jgi:hypothetical protein
MANPPYKQKMGEPPIFRFPLNPGVPSVTKITLKSNRLAIFFCQISGIGAASFFVRQALVLRFDLQCAPMAAAPLLPASNTGSSCDRDSRTPASKSALLNALTWCAAMSCFDFAC